MISSAPALAGSRVDRLGPAQIAIGLSVLSAILHLAVAGRAELSVDEAHYALYGLFLDWSYFDHPPMVGWLLAPVVAATREEWALRIGPILLSLAAAWLVYRMARRLFPDAPARVAGVAVVLVQSALVFQVLSIGLVPELPLLVFGLAAALALFTAVERGGIAVWLITGLLFGLAGLSKYTAVLLVVTALGWLSWQGSWSRLRTPGPWLALATAALVIAPVFYWNANHGWVSFQYQLGHGAPDRDWSLVRFLTAQAGQLIGYGPLVYLGGLAALAGAFRDRRHPGVRFSLLLALPVLLLFAWSGGFEVTLPHWPLLGWVALAPLTARWLVNTWERRGTRVLAWTGGLYAAVLTLAIHGLLFWPALPFEPYRHPLADLHGWREAAERAAARLDAGGGEAIYVTNWTQASRVAWYAWPRRVQVLDARDDQFDRWFGNPEQGDRGVLLLRERGGAGDSRAEERFLHCEPAEEWTYRLAAPVHRFRLLECRGFRG